MTRPPRRCFCGHVRPKPIPLPEHITAESRWPTDPHRLAFLVATRPELADLALLGSRLIAGIGENA